jgi:hypothetical protein
MSEIYISHHGVKGQKWGVRRYRNKDGSLTDAGRDRLSRKLRNDRERVLKRTNSLQLSKKHKKMTTSEVSRVITNDDKKMINDARKKWLDSTDEKTSDKYHSLYMDECRKVADKVVGEYGDRRITDFPEAGITVSFRDAIALTAGSLAKKDE